MKYSQHVSEESLLLYLHFPPFFLFYSPNTLNTKTFFVCVKQFLSHHHAKLSFFQLTFPCTHSVFVSNLKPCFYQPYLIIAVVNIVIVTTLIVFDVKNGLFS